MSMIFQSYAVWPNMTVEQNVAFGLELRKLPREARYAGASARCSTSCTWAIWRRAIRPSLSGGQQQRVALARAIVIQPQVLLLDEPLSNLDANLREEMRFEIRRLHDEFRITTVYVTHDQAEAMVTSDRIAVMNQGRIEQVDEPHTLYNRPKTRFVAGFIGRTNFIEGSHRRPRSHSTVLRCRSPASSAPWPPGKVTFSVRPQSMRLSEAPPAERNAPSESWWWSAHFWANTGTMSSGPATANVGSGSRPHRCRTFLSAPRHGLNSSPVKWR